MPPQLEASSTPCQRECSHDHQLTGHMLTRSYSRRIHVKARLSHHYAYYARLAVEMHADNLNSSPREISKSRRSALPTQ